MKIISNYRFWAVPFFLVLFTTQAMAQDNEVLFILPGPNHTQIWMLNDISKTPDPDASWIVYRADGGSSNFREVGSVSFPSSGARLQARLGDERSALVLGQLHAPNMESALRILMEQGLDTLGVLQLDPQILRAMGLVFYDESRNPEIPSVYRLDQVKNGTVQTSLSVKADGRLPEYPDRFRVGKYYASDSIAGASWSGIYPGDEFGLFYANVFRKLNKETDFQLVRRQLLSRISESDTCLVSFSEDVQKGDFLTYYMQIEDLAGNLGAPSDTIFLLAADDRKLPVMKNFLVTDSLNGMLLTWDKLPDNALFAGIQILKSRQTETDFIVVDTIAANLTSYLDVKVIPASTYYYKIRPILFHLPSGDPYPFTDAVGYKESRGDSPHPNTPTGVSAQLTPSGIEVSWQRSSEPDLFGYMVLRGISAKNLEVIEPSVKNYVYVDTTFSRGYSGQYHYAVQAIGLNQLLSDTSEVASVGVVQAIVLSPPGGITARRVAEGVTLQWDDVMQKDNKVSGFILYRRQAGTNEYRSLTSEPLLRPYYIDTTAIKTEAYDYAVAAGDAWGNQSVLSPNVTVISDNSNILQPPLQINIRNLQAGIDLSWPQDYMRVEGKSFIVYRREVGKSDFTKLSELQSGQYTFLDTKVSRETLYEYAISVKYKDSEGLKGVPVSIRR